LNNKKGFVAIFRPLEGQLQGGLEIPGRRKATALDLVQ